MSGGKIGEEQFYGNDWWSIYSGFKLNGSTNFLNWAENHGKETLNGKIVGNNIHPEFLNPVALGFNTNGSEC